MWGGWSVGERVGGWMGMEMAGRKPLQIPRRIALGNGVQRIVPTTCAKAKLNNVHRTPREWKETLCLLHPYP